MRARPFLRTRTSAGFLAKRTRRMESKGILTRRHVSVSLSKRASSSSSCSFSVRRLVCDRLDDDVALFETGDDDDDVKCKSRRKASVSPRSYYFFNVWHFFPPL